MSLTLARASRRLQSGFAGGGVRHFICAPRVTAVGEGGEGLAWRDGDPALVQKSAILAAGFHPELQHGVHPAAARFAGMVRQYGGRRWCEAGGAARAG